MTPNKLMVGSVTAGDVSVLMGDEQADLVYSDPPWGPGNLMYWRTKNSEVIRPDWNEFVAEFVKSVDAYCKGWAFVEMGLRWGDQLAEAFMQAGWIERHRHVMDYGKPPRPNLLMAFHRTETWPAGDGLAELPKWGWDATEEIARRFAIHGGIMLDPCIGLGKSATVFARRGMSVRGLELNPKRLEKAEARLGEDNGIYRFLISDANSCPELRGRCSRLSFGSDRIPIMYDGVEVGFVTLTEYEGNKIKVGPVYVSPAYRRKGLVRKTLSTSTLASFGYSPSATLFCWIADNNDASRNAFTKAGFLQVRNGQKGKWWERRPGQ